MVGLQKILRMITDLKHQVKCLCQKVEDVEGGGENFANADLTADDNRTHDFAGFNLAIDNATDFSISGDNGELDVSNEGVYLSGQGGVPTFIGTSSSGDIAIFPNSDSANVGIGINGTDVLNISQNEATAYQLIKYNDDKSTGYDDRSLVDKEYIDNILSGATGTFLSADAKTVTVTNGVIVSIV